MNDSMAYNRMFDELRARRQKQTRKAKRTIEFERSFSEWLDETQALDGARGAEQEAYTFEESESRRKESHT
jgi:hypothetical protein